MKNGIEGKVVIITGASSGIGEATALLFISWRNGSIVNQISARYRSCSATSYKRTRSFMEALLEYSNVPSHKYSCDSSSEDGSSGLNGFSRFD